jgi:hypothetical protein
MPLGPDTPIPLEDLPYTLQEMAAVIGLPATLTLVKHYGGTAINCPTPERMSPQHWLARLLGWEAAQALAKHYGGAAEIPIPRAVAAHGRLRRKAVLQQLRLGKTQRRVALEHGITERYVRMLVAEEPLVSPQQDLFDTGPNVIKD